MAAAAPHVILLTGAPDAAALSWTEADLTVDVLPAFADEGDVDEPGVDAEDESGFNRKDDSDTGGPPTATATPSAATAEPPAWRVLPLVPTRLHTGLTQHDRDVARQPWDPALPRDEAAFLNTQCLSFSPDGLGGDGADQPDTGAQEFLEQSFTTHEQGADAAAAAAAAATTNDAPPAPNGNGPAPPGPVPRALDLTDLRALPNAGHLRRLGVATQTVGLVVGVIEVAPPRTVRTRRGALMDIVELIVGDETKAGFGVTFWLPPAPPPPPPPAGPARRNDGGAEKGRSPRKPGRADGARLRASLARVRRRDVLLLRQVALGHYMGNVYGQSLGRDVTQVDLLYRFGAARSGEEGAGLYPAQALQGAGAPEDDAQLRKARRVREWVLNFVPR